MQVAPLDDADWRTRLKSILETMREMSLQTDPQEMVQMYAQRMQQLLPVDRRLSLSRRGCKPPRFRITRYTGWSEKVNPWKNPERLPELSGGLLSELIYSNQPRIIHDLQISPDDPAAEYLEGQRSLLAIPNFDQGEALNMVIATRAEPNAFREEDLPERVWMSNLFGRATQNLVLAEQLDVAYKLVERELQVVADIQRSLLPATAPEIPTLEIATHYQTSRQAGGDYYDFFPLCNGRWGMLIADVSGHGTPAAVVMAITHCIAHLHDNQHQEPHKLLEFLNHHLTTRYTSLSGHFVTAFYGIYDPATRKLEYSCAGHNPPRLRHCGESRVVPLDAATHLPLGFVPELKYHSAAQQLRPGDRLVLYTDGITEAANPLGELFGTVRLDMILGDCRDNPPGALQKVLDSLAAFTQGQAADDDRTMIVLDVS